MKVKTSIKAGLTLAMVIIVTAANAEYDPYNMRGLQEQTNQYQQQLYQQQMIRQQQEQNFILQQQQQEQRRQNNIENQRQYNNPLLDYNNPYQYRR